MNRRLAGRVAGAVTVLALAGGGVAVAASNSTDTTPAPAPPAVPYGADPQAPAPPPGAPGRWHGGPDRPDGPDFAGPGGPRGFGLGPGAGPALGDPGELTAAAARYLGLTAEQLHERLRDGRSLAEVARAEGRSVDGLEEAIVAAATARLDRAVDDGWLGPKARDAAVERLRDHVDELVAGRPGARPARPHLRLRGLCAPAERRGGRARRDDAARD